MGTTFCNINVFNPKGIEYKPGKNLTIVKASKEWDTIVQEDDIPEPMAIKKAAKAVSAAVEGTAISLCYLDDSAFELTVFEAGAKKGEYLLDNGFCKKSGLPNIINGLGLDDKAAKAFKKIITTEADARKVIELLCALSEIPLFLDKRMFDEGVLKVTELTGNAVIKQYTTAPKAKKGALGDKKEAQLLQEVSGVLGGFYDYENGIFSMMRHEDDGTLDRGHLHCYQLIQEQEPRFEKSHDIRMDLESLSTMKNIKGFVYHRQTPFYPETLSVYDDTDSIGYIAQGDACDSYRDRILVPVDKRVFPKYQIQLQCDDLKVEGPEGLVTYSQCEAKYLVREGDYYKPLRKEREFEPTPDQLHDMGYDCRKLDHFYADSEEIVRIMMVTDIKEAQSYLRVDYFGHDYVLKRTEQFPIKSSFDFESIWGGCVYIREKNLIFAGGYSIDLGKKKISEISELPAKLKQKLYACHLCRNKAGKAMVAVIMDKMICILNDNLKLQYHAKFKESIENYYFDESGNLFVVTCKRGWKMPYDDYREDSGIKLYKLEI
ncbi:hypothetical protein NXH67_03625 [Butyrivibrio sp. DSM 10294]|uniref:hypothetical protein n=1 Tax=Butyrivibrio sp. DSM 10294 TaxID=2972457 RepID=UPI00234F2D62|nr:hypothetical protein [Butyrivibrio sp. DSM 10294]MDC7292603.1 hypothetical protein [Butyrivibrio sp. DSM 10294]